MRSRLLLLLSAFLLSACATAQAYSGAQPLSIAALSTSTFTPSATFTETMTVTITPTFTNTATVTSSPTNTPSPTPLPTETSATPSATFTITLTPSRTPIPLNTLTATRTRTVTRTLTPTRTSTSTRTLTPSKTFTFTPSLTFTPTFTLTPSLTPTPSTTPTRPPSSTPDSRIQSRATLTPYPPPVFPTGDASKLKKPPVSVTNEPHLIFVRPVPNSAPSSQYRYGMTYEGRLAPHHGTDSVPAPGIAVGAAGPGTVFWAGDDLTQVFGTKENFYGTLVVLKMNDAWEGHTIYTLYGHLSSVAVAVGQQVNTNDLLGYTGDSGVAYGAHLHFEVRLDDPYSYFDSVRNPELWYKPIVGAGVIAGRLINTDGRFIPGARIFITCKDALRFVDTYWDQGTPPDNVLVENFAVSDIPQGNCNVETGVNGKLYRTSVYVPPGEVGFVIIQTEDK